jgi:predicted nuclease of predicted toxin-antitoxin system
MRILLDECLPTKLKNYLPGQDVRTVREMGWGGKTNGELLQLARPQFDLFLTYDQGFPYQQNLSQAGIAILLLTLGSNRLESVLDVLPQILDAISTIRPGQFLHIGKT